MLRHRSSNNERIMTEWITILDFYQISLWSYPSEQLAYDHQLLQYLIVSSAQRSAKGRTMRRSIGDQDDHLCCILSPF
jgi:hypothetical protein